MTAEVGNVGIGFLFDQARGGFEILDGNGQVQRGAISVAIGIIAVRTMSEQSVDDCELLGLVRGL